MLRAEASHGGVLGDSDGQEGEDAGGRERRQEGPQNATPPQGVPSSMLGIRPTEV